MKKTIVIVVGARPQFIKIMPLVRALSGKHRVKIIHTGQHYDHKMSQIFFGELKIPKPDCNLNAGSGLHGSQTAKMLKLIEEKLIDYKTDMLVVVGDTNSTLAGSLAASKINIPIAHIESGLRSFRKTMPEEVNRVITDHVSSLLFCPTQNAVKNLKKEGIVEGVYMTGDIMLDVLKIFLPACRKNIKIMKSLGLKKKGYFLLTIHRDYNTDSKMGLRSLIDKIGRLGEKGVFPVHPRTRRTLESYGLWKKLNKCNNVVVTEPLGYIDFITLQMNAAMIVTDSGGIQKEAYLLKVPCLTLRDETEWVETLKGNANKLAGRYGKGLNGAVQPEKWNSSWKKDVYGAGHSAKKTANILNKALKMI